MADLDRRLLDQIDPRVELSQFVMTSRRVGEDLDSIETHEDVRSVGNRERQRGELERERRWSEEGEKRNSRSGRKQLLTHLHSDTGVESCDDRISEGNSALRRRGREKESQSRDEVE